MKEMHWFILRASYFGRNESIKTIILTKLIIHTKILFQFCLFIVPKVLLVSNCVEGKSVQGWFSGSDGHACRIKLSGSVQQCSCSLLVLLLFLLFLLFYFYSFFYTFFLSVFVLTQLFLFLGVISLYAIIVRQIMRQYPLVSCDATMFPLVANWRRHVIRHYVLCQLAPDLLFQKTYYMCQRW